MSVSNQIFLAIDAGSPVAAFTARRGAPSTTNLMLQPRAGTWNAHQKNALERRLSAADTRSYRMVTTSTIL
jgi:hypothetical protein